MQEIRRTEFRNPGETGPREGEVHYEEALNDVENYQMQLDRYRGRGWFTWGVVQGLEVSPVPGQPGVRVSPGSALDRDGNLVVLAVDSSAVVDPTVDPHSVENIPTVLVGPDGVMVPPPSQSAEEYVVALTWREVAGTGGLTVRRHAPWLRMLPADGIADDGEHILLANVIPDNSGNVDELTDDLRRLAGLRPGGVQFWATGDPGGPGLGQLAVAELYGSTDGGIQLDLLAPGGARHPALVVDGDTRDITMTGGLRLDGFTIGAGTDGAWRLTDRNAGRDRLIVDKAGNLGIGLASSSKRPLHVEGLGIHTGGEAGGYSFGDRTAATFVERPAAGERWLWYAAGGAARLWSGTDKLWVDKDGNVGIGVERQDPIKRTVHIGGSGSGVHIDGVGAGYSFCDRDVAQWMNPTDAGERWSLYAQGGAARLWSASDQLVLHAPSDHELGLEVYRRMRVRQESSQSAGIWFFQDDADRGFVGMVDSDNVGLYGGTGGIWGLKMSTMTGEVSFSKFATFHGNLGKPDGPLVLRLFGSEIGDTGNNVLFIRSGGNVIDFNGGDTVFFRGDIHVDGQVFKRGGNFRIDHPLDPTGSYLSHSFVEAPERLNVYVGTVVTDDDGQASIELPDYFEALNRDHRVQLTPVGALARVAVSSPLKDHRIAIIADEPGLEIAWQVTGVRQDPWANQNPLIVEERKPDHELGTYLQPDVYGQQP